MPRFAANLTMMFTEVPLRQRFSAAAAAGFPGVEIQFPYELSPDELAARLQETGLELVLFNVAPGDWAAGERGLAAQKGREAEFRALFDQALVYARATGCRRIHAMSGLAVSADDDVFIENLKWAAERGRPDGVIVLIEPINTFDMPGYHFSDLDHARRTIAAVSSDNVGLQFDFYHRQRMCGDAVEAFERYSDIVRHVQIAGSPDRNEPDTGDLDAGAVVAELNRNGYAGWIGCEYNPRARTQDGLDWYERFR